MQPTVSFIMPFLNSESTLAAAIRSVLQQSRSDWELVMCDDGSTDASLHCVRQFDDPRISVWSDGARKGLAGRLNECIDRARGRYTARMDSDDVNYPERLAIRSGSSNSIPKSTWWVPRCWCLVTTAHRSASACCRKRTTRSAPTRSTASAWRIPPGSARREWFERWRYRPEALRYEDVELLYRSRHDSRFANVPEILYGYREPRGGFRKRLKTRAGRVRFLREAGSGVISSGEVVQAAVAESVKSVSDALLVGAGLRYRYLRRREQALTESESRNLGTVCTRNSTPGSWWHEHPFHQTAPGDDHHHVA